MCEEAAEPDLDPRIQIELEKLNSTTDEINRLEIEYDEANTTFGILLTECTRRLNVLSKKLGSCIEKSRPYYDLLKSTKKAQQECQEAAMLFQKANGIYTAAKETVALAEERFLSNQHAWQFDNAWQEMLNHATMKVTEAEHQRAESGREHQRRAGIFKDLELRLKTFEDKYHKQILKARPYFDEKQLCEEQLTTQKSRIEALRKEITNTKQFYSQTLKQLEQISNEIHQKRNGTLSLIQNKLEEDDLLRRPREPGVGAAALDSVEELRCESLPDINAELDKCEVVSLGGASSCTVSSMVSEEEKLEENAVRPVDGGEGQSCEEVYVSECVIQLKI